MQPFEIHDLGSLRWQLLTRLSQATNYEWCVVPTTAESTCVNPRRGPTQRGDLFTPQSTTYCLDPLEHSDTGDDWTSKLWFACRSYSTSNRDEGCDTSRVASYDMQESDNKIILSDNPKRGEMSTRTFRRIKRYKLALQRSSTFPILGSLHNHYINCFLDCSEKHAPAVRKKVGNWSIPYSTQVSSLPLRSRLSPLCDE